MVDPIRATLRSVMSPGFGVLVIDTHAEALVAGAAESDVAGFLSLAGSAAERSGVISAVLMTPDGMASASHVGPLAVTEPAKRSVSPDVPSLVLGTCLPASDLDEAAIETARAAGSQLVEIRANLSPGDTPPGTPATEADVLAQAALLAQQRGMLPILTFAMPDLGGQTLNVSHAITANALRGLVTACHVHGVDLASLVIRTNMVTAGVRMDRPESSAEVGRATVAVLTESLPPDLGGVLLLSGGHPLSRACEYLAATIAASGPTSPWPLSFAFARALLRRGARLWDGTTESPMAAREIVESCRLAALSLKTASAA